MILRSAQETLESLRVTLQKLEHTAADAQGADSMATFKSILLNRIADLEMPATVAPANAEIADPPAQADLDIPSSMAQEEPQSEARDVIQLEAVD